MVALHDVFLHCIAASSSRTQSSESEYLSAGSRLLSAACIPQPKLLIHYKAVNSSQEQVFNLDIPSARCWLRHNHLWANEVWAHWTQTAVPQMHHFFPLNLLMIQTLKTSDEIRKKQMQVHFCWLYICDTNGHNSIFWLRCTKSQPKTDAWTFIFCKADNLFMFKFVLKYVEGFLC